MLVSSFNKIYKFQVRDISDACYNNILKRKAGYLNNELSANNKDILTFLYLRTIHQMNIQKKNHETLFLPY